MAIILDGTAGIANNATDLSYTGTLTGGTGVVNIGSGQVYKDASGNVGVGTASPASKLEVSGSGTLELARFATTTDNTPSIGIYSNGSIRGKLRASSAETALLSQGALPLLLGTNDTERARIDSSGNLLVGSTSLPDSGYSMSLNVVNTNGFILKPPTNKNYNALGFRNSSNSEVGYINCTASATSFGTSSDYRLKDNILPMTGALEKVAQLKPCTYTWKVDGSDGQGFIAHELQSVVPECVVGEKDAVNEDGTIKAQGIDTSFLSATITAALQELHAIVKAQAVEIADLKARLP